MTRPRRIEVLTTDSIIRGERRRAINDGAVATLVESLSRIGLRVPISVRLAADVPDDETGEILGQAYVLIAGSHRLEAARRLGWSTIEAFVGDVDEVEAELWEIAENLHRAELTALERDEQVARWIELSATKVSSQIAPKPKGGRPESGVRAAARELGIDRDDARRAAKVAALTAEVKAAAKEVGLDDNRSALLGAAKADDGVAYLRAEHVRREVERARKEAEKLNGDQNRVIALSVAEEFAEWLMARIDLHEMPTIISWLEAAKSKDVIAALRRRAA